MYSMYYVPSPSIYIYISFHHTFAFASNNVCLCDGVAGWQQLATWIWPGALYRSVRSHAEKALIQLFLASKAVQGHTSFLSSCGMSPREESALKSLHEMGWVVPHNLDAGRWQLTIKPLEFIQVNMLLQFPWNVFQLRANLPLENATCFELVLMLQNSGWEQLSAQIIQKKKVSPFTDGHSDWRCVMFLSFGCSFATVSQIHNSWDRSAQAKDVKDHDSESESTTFSC